VHWKWRVRLGLLAGFLLLQVWPYQAASNPPERGEAPMPGQLRAWIQESCFDCHSHQVRYPWYASLAPLSWWIADDVRRGRAGLNFSTWSDYTPRQRALGWRRSLQRIREQRMPPLSYRLMHGVAISEKQVGELEALLKQHERTEAAGMSTAELLAWPAAPLVETEHPLRGVFLAKGLLRKPLRLDQALVLVDGDLTVAAGIYGRGAVLATGRLTIGDLAGEVGPLALVGPRGIRLSGKPRCRLTGFLSGTPIERGELEVQNRSSFSMVVAGVRQARLEYCRDDGQLGERLERQVVIRYGLGKFVLWDPEFQTVRTARGVEEALQRLEEILASDPATSIVRWRRRFRNSWKTCLEQLSQRGEPALLQLQSSEGDVPMIQIISPDHNNR